MTEENVFRCSLANGAQVPQQTDQANLCKHHEIQQHNSNIRHGEGRPICGLFPK